MKQTRPVAPNHRSKLPTRRGLLWTAGTDAWTSASRAYLLAPPIASRWAIAADKGNFYQDTVDITLLAGQQAIVAASSDGTGQTIVDDVVELTITNEDTSVMTWGEDYSNGCGPLSYEGPHDITSYFKPGDSSVTVTLRDKCGGRIGSDPLWLVIMGPGESQTYGCGGGLDATDPSGCTSDPVDTATGAYTTSTTDLSLPGVGLRFRFDRSYVSADATATDMGRGWSHSYSDELERASNGDVTVRNEIGQEVVFTPEPDCSYTSPPGAVSELSATWSTPSYQATVMDDSPVAYWRLGEASGTTANDETTNNLDGTYNGGPTLGATGALANDSNTAVHLDGLNDYVNVTNASLLNPTKISVEAWVKSTGPTWNNYAWVVAKRNQYVLHPWSGTREMRFYINIGGTWHWIGFAPPTIQGWHHYVGTFNGSGSLRLFVDGVKVATKAVSGSISAGSGNALLIGADLVGATRYGAGDLDEVAIFNRALSAAEVAEHYGAGTGQGCGNPTEFHLTRKDQTELTFSAQGRLTQVADRNDNDLAMTYTNGELSTITDTTGREVALTRDGSGRVTEVELPDGRSVGYGYTDGLLTSVTDVRGGVTGYSYDGSERLTVVTDQSGHEVISNVYGTDGRVTEQIDAEGHTSYFGWNATTGVSTWTDNRGKQWKDTYSRSALISREDPLGNTISYEYDSNGHRTNVTDARDNAVTMTYDARGNMLTRTAPFPLSYSESWTYNSRNDVTGYTNARGNTTTYGYDASGNLTSITEPGDVVTSLTRASSGLVMAVTNPRGKTSSFEHDAAGNVVEVTAPGGGVTTLNYDSSGRVTSVVDPRGNESGATATDYDTLFTYDAANHLVTQTDPLGNATEWTYALDGRLLSVEDPKARTTTYGYDDNHRLLSVTAPDATVTSYSYDDSGNLIARTDAETHTTTYAYDDANRLKSVISPTNQEWTYSYDAAGNLTEVVDAAGNQTTSDTTDGKTIMAYDVIDRLTSVDYSDSTPDVSFTYDANSNRTQMTDGFSTESYAYDSLDRPTSVTRGTGAFSYEYNTGSMVTKRTYPDGTVVDYTYDDDGRMASVTSGGNSTAYAYDVAGDLVTTTLPSGNGHEETRAYDSAGRLTSLLNKRGSNVLSKALYTYDAASNRLTMETLEGTTTYDYDAQDRLTEACLPPGCNVTGEDFVRYTYDDVGNRLTEARPSGTTSYSYNAADQLLSTTASGVTTSLDHDLNGNLIDDGSREFTYDLAGRMTSVIQGAATTDYEYDGDGKRLRAIGSSTTKFLWDPNNALPMLVSERDGSDALLRRYVNGTDVVSMTTGGSDYFFHRDGLGSITDVTDASGDAQWSYAYEPFGAQRDATQVDPSAPANSIGFTGQYLDPTGLYHLRARQYSPDMGRFVSTDPISGLVNQPGIASYAYVGNRAASFTDPSGMVPAAAVPVVIEVGRWVLGGALVLFGGATVADAIEREIRRVDIGDYQEGLNVLEANAGREPQDRVMPHLWPPSCRQIPGCKAIALLLAGTMGASLLAAVDGEGKQFRSDVRPPDSGR